MPKHPARVAISIGVLVALGTTVALAAAFPPYSYPSVSAPSVASASRDASSDGRAGPVDGFLATPGPTLAAALEEWPEYYRAGLVGVDGLVDLTGPGTAAPSTVRTWQRYVVVEARNAQSDPSYDEDERAQILAFSHGLLNGGSPATLPPDGAGAGLADAAGTAGRDPSVTFAVPTAFLYDAFIDPYQPLPVNTCGDGQNGESELTGQAADTVADDGCPGGVGAVGKAEPKRGYLIDYFLDLRADLELLRERIRMDREYTDAANGVLERRSKPLDTIRGLRVATVDVEVCAGARDTCLRDVTGDLAEDGRLWFVEQYLTDWVAEIDDGLRHFGELGVAVTRGLYDPESLRHARTAECGTPPSGIVHPWTDCESRIEVTDAVLWASEPFVDEHLLAMLGSPSALNASGPELDEFAAMFSGVVDPLVSPIRDGRHTLVSLARAKIERAVSDALSAGSLPAQAPPIVAPSAQALPAR